MQEREVFSWSSTSNTFWTSVWMYSIKVLSKLKSPASTQVGCLQPYLKLTVCSLYLGALQALKWASWGNVPFLHSLTCLPSVPYQKQFDSLAPTRAITAKYFRPSEFNLNFRSWASQGQNGEVFTSALGPERAQSTVCLKDKPARSHRGFDKLRLR